MEFQSERLILRPWKAEDAQVLYELANDPDVGPAAGWPVHQSEEESRQIIESVLSNPLDFAICLKETSTPIGAISLMVPKLKQREGASPYDKELGFWIGKPYWGHGYVEEAANMLIDYGFEDLWLDQIWCAHYAGNSKSARAQAKIGFCFFKTEEHVLVLLLGEFRDEVINRMTREEWKALRNAK